MFSRNELQKIDRYRQSLIVAWANVDYNDWPVKLNAAFHLFLEDFGREFREDLLYLEEQDGMTMPEIARNFYNPARIYRLIDNVIYGVRRLKYSLEQQRRLTLKLLEMVKSLKYGSEFNHDGRNTIFTPERQTEAFDKIRSKDKCTQEESRYLHRFCGLIWAYTESVFFRAHDVTKELHGPYTIDGSTDKLNVKEYLNLQPREIWPDMPLLPCDNIKVYKLYNNSVDIEIDAFNHIYHKGGSPVPNLLHYYIEENGKEVTLDRLEELSHSVEDTITSISDRIEEMSWGERVCKYAEIFWFRKRPLRIARGLDWTVPEHVKEKIMAGKENPKRVPILTEQQVERLAKLTI
ncbi:MAG: hypothetical protein GY765_30250 [bacterium]|nr:hypothetical protein [bacterium]